MNFEIRGWEGDGVTLDLDHRNFAYAGNFGVSKTGKAVATESEVLGAVAFSSDYSDETAVRLRYVTVREDRQGEGIGSQLLRFTADRLDERYESVTIAVNNPVAYRSGYRGGFHSTGTETGIAELELRYDPDSPRSHSDYREGLAVFESRDLPEFQQRCLEISMKQGPPAIVAIPE